MALFLVLIALFTLYQNNKYRIVELNQEYELGKGLYCLRKFLSRDV